MPVTRIEEHEVLPADMPYVLLFWPELKRRGWKLRFGTNTVFVFREEQL